MAKKVVYLYKMPNGLPYIRKEKSYGTTYIQNKKSGLLKGRKMVKGKGDKTGVKRVVKDFILVKKSDRARGHKRVTKDYQDGYIVGRGRF